MKKVSKEKYLADMYLVGWGDYFEKDDKFPEMMAFIDSSYDRILNPPSFNYQLPFTFFGEEGECYYIPCGFEADEDPGHEWVITWTCPETGIYWQGSYIRDVDWWGIV